jgi:phage-related baseplate assembly protein
MPTFRKQASVAVVHVSAQEPAIAEVVVTLYELNAVTLCQAQLVGATCYEVVHDEQDGPGRSICHAALSCRHVGAV